MRIAHGSGVWCEPGLRPELLLALVIADQIATRNNFEGVAVHKIDRGGWAAHIARPSQYESAFVELLADRLQGDYQVTLNPETVTIRFMPR